MLLRTGILIFIATFTACRPKIPPRPAQLANSLRSGASTERACEDLQEIALPPYYLQNNMWGKGNLKDYEQCVGRSRLEPVTAGWHWNWPSVGDHVRGYPYIGFGQDPWRPTSTTPALPRVAGSIGTLAVDYDIRVGAVGKYNVAFDVWITAAPGVTSPPEANIRRELMIWLAYTENPLPPAWLLGDVTIDGEVYELYRGVNEPTEKYVRDYLAFLKKTPELTGTTNIHEFVKYLLGRGFLSPEEYIRNVFLGTEIWHGEGETILERYAVRTE